LIVSKKRMLIWTFLKTFKISHNDFSFYWVEAIEEMGLWVQRISLKSQQLDHLSLLTPLGLLSLSLCEEF